MNYGYSDGCLYFHSAKEGLKLDFIKSNSMVCFEIETEVSVQSSSMACKWDMKYKSIIGHGNIEEVSDHNKKRAAMNVLLLHYSGSGDWDIPDKQIENVHVLKLKITEMTGKGNS